MNNDRLDPWVQENIEAALKRVDYGQITLIIHERKVVCIDVSDRRREKKSEVSRS